MPYRLLLAIVCTGIIIGVMGCGSGFPPSNDPLSSGSRTDHVDLDKVIKILTETLDEMDLQTIAGASDKDLEAMANQKPEDKGKLRPVKALDKDKEQAFLKKFGEKLNQAHLIPDPIGVTMAANGAIQGFVDKNKDGLKEGTGERELFKIQLDAERQRIIASDATNTYHRDHRYGFSPTGLIMGYLLGSMLNRQQASGFDASRLGQTKMSPEGYHKTTAGRGPAAPAGQPGGAATPAARAPSPPTSTVTPGATAKPPSSTAPSPSSARGQGGSRGFSVGK